MICNRCGREGNGPQLVFKGSKGPVAFVCQRCRNPKKEKRCSATGTTTSR